MSEFTIVLTKHAIDRAKERLRLTEAQLARLMPKIRSKGAVREHMPKELLQWFDRRLVSPDARRESVIHADHLFIIERGVLITLTALPDGLRRFAIAAARANRAARKVQP